MANSLEDFVKLAYSTEVVPEQTTDGSLCYIACHPELPGCMSHGDTPEETISNLLEAKKLYIKTLLEKGQDVPLPKSSAMAIWEVAGLETEIPVETLYLAPNEVNPIESLDKEDVAVLSKTA